jgi:hypothetical protein
MYFLMSSEETLTSEVPYPLDAGFVGRAQKWLGDGVALGAPGNPPRVTTIRPPPLPRSAGA